MFLLFEEAGKFMAGRVLSEAESSAQVELDSGKRVKVKAAAILLKFEQPAPAQLLTAALVLSQTIELELAWEFAPEGEFGFAELAREYFSAHATLVQQTATLLKTQVGKLTLIATGTLRECLQVVDQDFMVSGIPFRPRWYFGTVGSDFWTVDAETARGQAGRQKAAPTWEWTSIRPLPTGTQTHTSSAATRRTS